MTTTYLFGFLAKPLSVDAGDIAIRPVAAFQERLEALNASLHEDGHFYPPSTQKVAFPNWPDESHRTPVPRTKRPAHLFHLPPSHEMVLSAPIDPSVTTGDASFVVQALAYAFGTRLQLDGFQFDGRVPIERPSHHVYVAEGPLRQFLSTAYGEWRARSHDQRLRLTNILYMHSKAPSYDWIWEQYFIEYLVTDALYEFCCQTGVATTVSHSERIREMCRRLGMHQAADNVVESLVTTRNALFHEAQWEGERPGYRLTQESYDTNRLLRSLNHRLIASVLGGVPSYAKSSWEDWRNLYEFA